MKFKLTTRGSLYSSDEADKLQSMGFKLMKSGRSFMKIEPGFGTIELTTVEQMVQFMKEWGRIEYTPGDVMENCPRSRFRMITISKTVNKQQTNNKQIKIRTMKNIKIGVCMVLAVTGLAFLNSTPAKAQHRPGAAVVVFAAEESYEDGSPYPRGFVLYVVDRSPGAPEIKPGMTLSGAMEYLLNQGYEIKESTGFRFTATRK